MFYNADKDRVETQIDIGNTQFWLPIDACPGARVRDDFVHVLVGGGNAESVGQWAITEAAGGSVTATDGHGGGLTFECDGNGDEAEIIEGAVYSRYLSDEPHVCFGGELSALVASKYAELGFEDTTGDHHIKIVYDGSAGEIIYSVDNGTGTPNTGTLSGSPDTDYHIYMMRFGDDGTNGAGSQCEIAVDGVLLDTLTLLSTSKYPGTSTAMSAVCRGTSSAASAWEFYLRHINICSDLVM